jgi:type III pantothenate kinase
VLVINLGTCITYDFIDDTGTYFGGAIAPGLHMRFKALNTFTGKLPLIDHRDIDFLIGQTTEESILSGVINGMTAEIEGIAEKYLEKWPGLRIILSGGDLNNFVNRLKISTFAHPNIVITGLQKILDFNVSKNC